MKRVLGFIKGYSTAQDAINMNSDVVECLNIAKRCGTKIPRNVKLHPKFIEIREILIIPREE